MIFLKRGLIDSTLLDALQKQSTDWQCGDATHPWKSHLTNFQPQALVLKNELEAAFQMPLSWTDFWRFNLYTPGQGYHRHRDTRRHSLKAGSGIEISLVICISPAEVGGLLNVWDAKVVQTFDLAAGDVVAFQGGDEGLEHEVTVVESGRRITLVSWLKGR